VGLGFAKEGLTMRFVVTTFKFWEPGGKPAVMSSPQLKCCSVRFALVIMG